MDPRLAIAGVAVLAAIPIAAHLSLIAWRRSITMTAALANLVDEAPGDVANLPNGSFPAIPQDSLWQPEHSHRSPLSGRRPLGVFSAGRPLDHAAPNSNDR